MQTSTKPEDVRVLKPTSKPFDRVPRVLAADDQQHILDALELLLRPQGYEVDTARSPALVREALLSSSYDALLIDLNYTRDTTSGGEGLELISEIISLDGSTP